MRVLSTRDGGLAAQNCRKRIFDQRLVLTTRGSKALRTANPALSPIIPTPTRSGIVAERRAALLSTEKNQLGLPAIIQQVQSGGSFLETYLDEPTQGNPPSAHEASNLELQPGDIVTIFSQRDISVPQVNRSQYVIVEAK